MSPSSDTAIICTAQIFPFSMFTKNKTKKKNNGKAEGLKIIMDYFYSLVMNFLKLDNFWWKGLSKS